MKAFPTFPPGWIFSSKSHYRKKQWKRIQFFLKLSRSFSLCYTISSCLACVYRVMDKCRSLETTSETYVRVQLMASTREANPLFSVPSKLLGISIPGWTHWSLNQFSLFMLRLTYNTYTISRALPALRPELFSAEQPSSHTHLERNVVFCKLMETELV